MEELVVGSFETLLFTGHGSVFYNINQQSSMRNIKE